METRPAQMAKISNWIRQRCRSLLGQLWLLSPSFVHKSCKFLVALATFWPWQATMTCTRGATVSMELLDSAQFKASLSPPHWIWNRTESNCRSLEWSAEPSTQCVSPRRSSCFHGAAASRADSGLETRKICCTQQRSRCCQTWESFRWAQVRVTVLLSPRLARSTCGAMARMVAWEQASKSTSAAHQWSQTSAAKTSSECRAEPITRFWYLKKEPCMPLVKTSTES